MRRVVLAALAAIFLVVTQIVAGLSAGFTGPLTAAAASSAGSGGHPNRYSPPAAKPVNHLPAPPATPLPKPAPFQPRIPPVPMQPAAVPVDPVSGAHFVSSDGVLELTVPAGAVTAAGESLAVRQVLPASGSNAGGSGTTASGPGWCRWWTPPASRRRRGCGRSWGWSSTCRAGRRWTWRTWWWT